MLVFYRLAAWNWLNSPAYSPGNPPTSSDHSGYQRNLGTDETGAFGEGVSLGSQQSLLDLFTTTISQAEVLYGIAPRPKGKRGNLPQAAADSMFTEDFTGRILPFDEDAARLFSEIVVARRFMGRPIAVLDAEIAAIARARASALATRDTPGFEDCGITVLNPWM